MPAEVELVLNRLVVPNAAGALAAGALATDALANVSGASELAVGTV